MRILFKIISILLLTSYFFHNTGISQNNIIDNYNVSWTKTSKIASDAMPLGNGTTGALISVLENGHIWVSVRHVDAWSEAHRLLKLGDIEISVSPNPFQNHFKQELILKQGALFLEGDAGFNAKIWIDANNSVIHMENNSKEKFKIDVKLHTWRNLDRNITETNFNGVKGGIKESADVLVENDKNALIWYHENSHTKAFEIAIDALEIPGLDKKHSECIRKSNFWSLDYRR